MLCRNYVYNVTFIAKASEIVHQIQSFALIILGKNEAPSTKNKLDVSYSIENNKNWENSCAWRSKHIKLESWPIGTRSLCFENRSSKRLHVLRSDYVLMASFVPFDFYCNRDVFYNFPWALNCRSRLFSSHVTQVL